MALFRKSSTLNYVVIALLTCMIALSVFFIYSSIGLKKRVTVESVQKMELTADLVARAAVDLMGKGYSKKSYARLLAYSSMSGVDETGIFDINGREILGAEPAAEGAGVGSVGAQELEVFKRVVVTGRRTGFFSRDYSTFTQYIPLYREPGCEECSALDSVLPGILKVKLSATEGVALLLFIQRLIWTLGIIAVLPLAALLVAWAIIREKNTLYSRLKESNSNLIDTYNTLSETRGYLQRILDNSRVIIVTTDIDARIVEFNKEAEKLLEYGKEEVVGLGVFMLYDEPDDCVPVMNEARDSGSAIWASRNREVVMKSKSGRKIYISLTLSTMVGDKGRMIGTVGIGKDISEQKMLHFKLMQSEKLAGIGTLASGIAHEINNPLAGILGMAEAILGEEEPEIIHSHAGDIVDYALNASNIVKELSAYSRDVKNEVHSSVDLSGVIEQSIKMAGHSASFTKIKVQRRLDSGCLVVANTGELQQVFVNLIINAIHAIGEGNGTLKIECSRIGDFARAVIADTGDGIDEAELSQIFDPFFTTKPVGLGTGLGLYVVYRIVTKFGGTIDVCSYKRTGTTFTIKFPLSKEQEKSAVL